MAEIDPTDSRTSDPTAAVRPVHKMTKIDRIDDRGDVREHLTRGRHRTICGLKIDASGRWELVTGGALPCRRCEKIAERCQIVPSAASGEQTR